MDKLKEVIKEYGRWSELSTYVERIEPTGRNRFRSYGANIFIYDILLQRFCSYGANNFINQSRKNKTYIKLRNTLLNRIINQSRKNKTFVELIYKMFMEIIIPIFQKITNNVFQIEKLESIRNTLLPKLISGEIKVLIDE